MSTPNSNKFPRSKRPVLIVFDFDHTLIDADSDLVLFQMLPYGQHLLPGFTSLRTEEGLGWVQIMQSQFTSLAAQNGYSKADVLNHLRNVKMDPTLVATLRTLHESQTRPVTLVIASNANTIFISEILRANGIDDTIFSRIYTNPGKWLVGDVLEVLPYQAASERHGCPRGCPINMCKSSILRRARRELGLDLPEDLQIIYVGDGGNDYCPSLSLAAGDLIFAREDFTLHSLINGDDAVAVGSRRLIHSPQSRVVNVSAIQEDVVSEFQQRNGNINADVLLWKSQEQLGCMLLSVLGG